MKTMNIFWGVFWILAGVAILLKMLGVVDIEWTSVLRAWPFIIVFIGISLLPLNDMVKMLVLILTLLVMCAFVVTDSRRPGRNWLFKEQRSYVSMTGDSNLSVEVEEEEGITELEIHAGVFELNLEGETEDTYIDISHAGNFIEPKLFDVSKKRYRVSSLTGDCQMRLNPNKIWNIDAEFGVGGAYLDLRPFLVQKIEIKSGASATDIRLGDRSPRTKVEIKTGVGDVSIRLPKSSYCTLINDGSVFVNKDIEGFTKVSGNEFITADTKGAKSEVVIYYTGALSNIKIVRE